MGLLAPDLADEMPYRDYFLFRHNFLKDPVQREKDSLFWSRWLTGKMRSGEYSTLDPNYRKSIDNLDFDNMPFNTVAYIDRMGLDNEQTRRKSLAYNSKDEYEKYLSYPELYKPFTQWEWIQGQMANNVLNNKIHEEQEKSLNSSPDSQEYFDHMVNVPDPNQFTKKESRYTEWARPTHLYDGILQLLGLKDYNYKNGIQPRYRNVHGYSDYPSWVQGQLDRAEIDRQRAVEEENNKRLHKSYEKYMEQFDVID